MWLTLYVLSVICSICVVFGYAFSRRVSESVAKPSAGEVLLVIGMVVFVIILCIIPFINLMLTWCVFKLIGEEAEEEE